MKKLVLLKINFLLIVLIMAGTILSQPVNLPDKPTSWVNDYAGVLSADERETLNTMLAGLEKRSSNQIFIAIFKRLPENYYLEDFTVKLFEKWKPGLADKDNGILLTIFIDDHKMRFEIGYGLEDVITDAQSATLIRNYLAPQFKQGNYYSGIKAALDVLIPAVEGKYRIPVSGESNDGFSFGPGTIIIFFIVFFVLSRMLNARRWTGLGSKRRGSYWSGPFWWGGFGGGGSSGGGFGGGFGGGGFSGGFGGSSGGGGASGSW
jgi:uncharacterized protein